MQQFENWLQEANESFFKNCSQSTPRDLIKFKHNIRADKNR